jgi:hypothetical protein
MLGFILQPNLLRSYSVHDPKANKAAEVAVAAGLRGYGKDVEMFESKLKLVCTEMGIECTEMGIEMDSFRDLQKLSLKS